MLDYLNTRKQQTLAYLQRYLAGRAVDLKRIGPWGEDVVVRLLDYSSGGKMIRGALVSLGHELAGGQAPETAIPVAAAMELTQSFLLIHDDIMDHDDQRRGNPAIHTQYSELAWKRGYRGNTQHFGYAMGICAGDIAFSLAGELFDEAEVDSATYRRLMRRFVSEVAMVGVAQMHDVSNGVRLDPVSEDEIMSLYRYKTGRYTFSLPLMLGAITAGIDDDLNNALGEVGEEIGIIFQIKDDEIGIFSSDGHIGKPVGSDISEDKKTVLRARLFALAPESERRTLERLFGAETVTEHDVAYVRSLLESLGVRVGLQRELEARAAAVHSRIGELFGNANEAVPLLRELIDYNLTRDR